MNSLVVLLSVVALAAAKPSGLLDAGVISYAAPAIATYPAAVSQQSRIDVKSSPSIVSTAAVAPITRTVIAEPALVAAPTAVSSQSRIDIKSSPAVVTTLAAAPIAYSAPTFIKSAAITTPAIAAPVFATPDIASPTFFKTAAVASPVYYKTAIAAPAFVKTTDIAAPGIVTSALAAPSLPLDTPEVIAARNAHLEAKALAGAHLIRKRSASLITSPILSTYSAAPVISTYATSPLVSTYSAPIALSTPLITKAYSVHPW